MLNGDKIIFQVKHFTFLHCVKICWFPASGHVKWLQMWMG